MKYLNFKLIQIIITYKENISTQFYIHITMEANNKLLKPIVFLLTYQLFLNNDSNKQLD